MSNVKPGDLAKVILDPANQGILGMQVLVEGRSSAPHVLLKERLGGLVWAVEQLETRAITTRGKVQLIRAGTKMLCFDYMLKRIDPPADGEELWRDTPIPSDTITPKEPQDA